MYQDKERKDYLVRALSADKMIRAFALRSDNLVDEIRRTRDYSPTSLAALGRTINAALLMGDMLKNDDDLLTLQINGDGPIRQILVTSNLKGEVKGYASNPYVILEPNSNNHLNVSKAIGKGKLTVIKDYGLKEPYVSTVNLISSEVAEDITYYYAKSEQTPTACGLGVAFNHDLSIKATGGFLIQLLPNASEEDVSKLEESLKAIHSVTDILKEKDTPEELLKTVMKGFDIEFLERKEVKFKCSCSYEKGLNTIRSLGKEEILDIIKKEGQAEVDCAFCNKKYTYSKDELEKLVNEL